MEVNASQTHRQTATEASPLPLPSPVVPVNRASLSPDSGTHLVPYSLPTLDDFLPSRFYKSPALSQFPYNCPYLAPDSVVHRNETASVSTDSAMSECSSRTVSESSTAILDELQTCSYDTTDCSETPSPTLSQMSAVSDGTTLTNTAATSHVIMLPFLLLHFVQTGCQRGTEFDLVCYPITQTSILLIIFHGHSLTVFCNSSLKKIIDIADLGVGNDCCAVVWSPKVYQTLRLKESKFKKYLFQMC